MNFMDRTKYITKQVGGDSRWAVTAKPGKHCCSTWMLFDSVLSLWVAGS